MASATSVVMALALVAVGATALALTTSRDLPTTSYWTAPANVKLQTSSHIPVAGHSSSFRTSPISPVRADIRLSAQGLATPNRMAHAYTAAPATPTETAPGPTYGLLALVFAISAFFSAGWAQYRSQTKFAGESWAIATSSEEPANDDYEKALEKGMALCQQAIKEHPVILFMKGVPTAPQCGFSAGTVEILNKYPSVKWVACNVFQDPMIREGIKRVGSWPTIPQLYVNGELIGGYDIVKEMHETGELKELLPVTEGTQ
uniref:Glutaredoxin domain-containing protein n=1 Tax=Eutreptiella gymnastica TaxID=73025 RepID=A0A7S1J9H9_9EUGL|mmetsp:Transcript_75651/g.133692  ORF Transcript_75651/g.133692 Transcript_75651/m.133692 type:complete len:260 (+) Transcript_75651:28-807(+)